MLEPCMPEAVAPIISYQPHKLLEMLAGLGSRVQGNPGRNSGHSPPAGGQLRAFGRGE